MEEKKLQSYIASYNLNLVEAMQRIDNNAKGILYVIDENGCLRGSVTDGDIRRWIIRTGKLDTLIENVMHVSPVFISADEFYKAESVMRKHQITSLPITDKNGKIDDIIFLDDSKEKINIHNRKLSAVSVVIMAGGKGTRLYPYTKILPKPLIPIGDIPILERIMNCFREYGAEKFYLTLNYKKNMIKSYLADVHKEAGVTYIEEAKPLGTAGSLRLIKDHMDQPVFVTNCDILVLTDYGKVLRHHVQTGNMITIVSAMKKIEVPYGVVDAGENGVVTSMEEKPTLSYLVNTGMYIIDPCLFKWIPEDTVFDMTDLVDLVLRKKMQVGIYPVGEDVFLDMGEISEMKRMEEKLKNS